MDIKGTCNKPETYLMKMRKTRGRGHWANGSWI